MVHRVTKTPFNVYCQEKIYKPLGMRRTTFRPPGSWQGLIAPADYQGNRLRWGEVSDPTANRMGGVAGNAGVFSNVDELAIYVQMLLNGGSFQGKQILSSKAVAAMTKPYYLPGSAVQRGLGWDIESPYSKGFNAAFCFLWSARVPLRAMR